MSAQIISGTEIAATIRAEIADDVAEMAKGGEAPGLAFVLVGDDPASKVYVRMKNRACEETGIRSITKTLPADTPQAALLRLIDELNADASVDGILVQLPLPPHIRESDVLFAIDPAKDVDGFHPVNIGRLVCGEARLRPCTPYGIQVLLQRSGHGVEGKHVVVVGRSNIVGKPMANLLLRKEKGGNATVTVCHSVTADIAAMTRTADILIVAIGRPGFIRGDMVKPGAVVIDVGVNRVDDPTAERGYRLAGDCDFDAIREHASAITPVPGGVGPMTIAMLMKNTVTAARALRVEG